LAAVMAVPATNLVINQSFFTIQVATIVVRIGVAGYFAALKQTAFPVDARTQPPSYLSLVAAVS